MRPKVRISILLLGVLIFMVGIELWIGIVRRSIAAIGGDLFDVPFGRDLRGYAGAAELAAQRMGAAMYDFSQSVFFPSGAAEYVYPPWFAILAIPMSVVPFELLYVLWTALSVGLLAWVLSAMHVQSRLLVMTTVLFTIAGIAGMFFGQTSFILMAGLLWVVVAVDSDRWLGAGVGLSLLAFKPHLLIGIVIWWLVDIKRRWREIAAAALGTGVLIIASALWLPGSWGVFISSLGHGEARVPPEFEATLLSSLRLLLMNRASAILIVYSVLAGALLWGFVLTVRHEARSPRVLGSLAIAVALLISLHSPPYDWLLLVAAGGLLLGELDLTHSTIGWWGMLLGAVLAVDHRLVTWQMEHWGFGLQVAPWILLAMTVSIMFRARSVIRETADAESTDSVRRVAGNNLTAS